MRSGNVRAHVEQQPWSDSVKVTITAGVKPHVLRIDPEAFDGTRWEPFEEMTDPGPSLVLSTDVWEAIQQAAGQHTQATDATVEALRDTRTVRDRLLALAENAAASHERGTT